MGTCSSESNQIENTDNAKRRRGHQSKHVAYDSLEGY
jgi:hypothetical protein